MMLDHLIPELIRWFRKELNQENSMRLTRALFGVIITVAAAPAFGQAPVVASPDPESLFSSPDPKLHANKQVVLHIVRDLLEANHWDEAEKYLTKEYIQHNPNVASGRDPVVNFFGSRPKSPIPDRKSWKTKVVSVVAEKDLVVVSYVSERRDPRDAAKTYTTTWFDMWRIKDGKADEHWDGATIALPAAQTPTPSPSGAQ
jgi:predicted SnoaL-like aldol condensation-catalyzing enzyme